MQETVERLASSLLFEGYALYPYTPGATKNATPTPFGIVYPPAYSASQRAAFDHIQIQSVISAQSAQILADAEIEAEAMFLQAAGTRHKAVERRAGLESLTIGELAASGPVEKAFAFDAGSELGVATGEQVTEAQGALTLTVTLEAELLDGVEGAMARITARTHNTTILADGEAESMDRAAALRRSLLSTHTLLGLAGAARFVSPLENEGELGEAVQSCENINSWPVLASPDDAALLGAAILLPDHPGIAEASNVNMFDNTEMEEALTLHVQVLSDSEREAIGEQDPTVREMIERVEKTTPEQLLDMHGGMSPSEPGLLAGAPPAAPTSEPDFPEWSEPGAVPGSGSLPPGVPVDKGLGPSETPGEREVVVGGKAFRRGEKVKLCPGKDGDPYDKMLDGQPATIRRIYVDYDGRAYLGVTVDADPMAEILQDAGRYLFFFADEVAAIDD